MNIYILYTGGTIGCVGQPLAPMKGSDFQKAFEATLEPSIKTQLQGTNITFDYFSTTLDSTNMQPAQWVKMAKKIYENYNSFDGFIVLHGTDTMAWTSSALSFLLPGLTKPVIVTGSQLPLFYKNGDDPSKYQLLNNTDARRNIEGAISFLQFNFPEVGLYFDDHLIRGNRAVKSNASQFMAFSSPNYHYLGEFGVLPTFYNDYALPVPGSKAINNNYIETGKMLDTIDSNITQQSVIQFILFPAYYAEPDGTESLLVSMLEKITEVSPALKGIIFEAYGEGNIPDYNSMQALMRGLYKKGLTLVDCTQVFAGDVNYNAYATGAWLKEAGVIGGHDITPIAALTKLIVILALDPSISQASIAEKMGSSLAGELTNYYSLSGYRNDFLLPGQVLYSNNGNYQLENTIDGSLLLSDITQSDAQKVIWQEDLKEPGRLIMQADNNLVFYNHSDQPIWATNTAQIGINSYVLLGNNGSLALYNLDNDELIYTIFSGV